VESKGLTRGPKFIIEQGCSITTPNLTKPNTTYFKVEPKDLTTGPKFMIEQVYTITTPIPT